MSFEGNEYDKDVDGRVIHGHGFKPRRPFFFFFFYAIHGVGSLHDA